VTPWQHHGDNSVAPLSYQCKSGQFHPSQMLGGGMIMLRMWCYIVVTVVSQCVYSGVNVCSVRKGERRQFYSPQANARCTAGGNNVVTIV
jgi:hypothetical protein